MLWPSDQLWFIIIVNANHHECKGIWVIRTSARSVLAWHTAGIAMASVVPAGLLQFAARAPNTLHWRRKFVEEQQMHNHSKIPLGRHKIMIITMPTIPINHTHSRDFPSSQHSIIKKIDLAGTTHGPWHFEAGDLSLTFELAATSVPYQHTLTHQLEPHISACFQWRV